jgi:hypothetical protein
MERFKPWGHLFSMVFNELTAPLSENRGFPLHRTLPFHTNDMQTGLTVSPWADTENLSARRTGIWTCLVIANPLGRLYHNTIDAIPPATKVTGFLAGIL